MALIACQAVSRAPSGAAETCVRSDPQAKALVARFSLLRELDCSDLHGLPLADLGALAGLSSLRSLSVRGNYRTGAAELQQVRFRAPEHGALPPHKRQELSSPGPHRWSGSPGCGHCCCLTSRRSPSSRRWPRCASCAPCRSPASTA